uniref:Uncharacterized protein n=1 Tax=Oryza barthii TaxID=65489 RepID=A0A0D3F6I0_9ORYZ
MSHGSWSHEPPLVACRVVGVELRANAATDEVYARLALVAEGEMSKCSLDFLRRLDSCVIEFSSREWGRSGSS